MGDGIDFIGIGAQKAGTTALWAYLDDHPEVVVPAVKEAPFFSHDDRYERGLDWYLGEFFASARRDARWGTVTPHYMMGTPDAPVETIARRIRESVPDVRLMALLRDPVERAWSHYRMEVRREREFRPFSDAVSQQLELAALDDARRRPTETNSYVVQGEYGRVLETYLSEFPREQLFVALAEDLDRIPASVVRSVYRFIGVDADHAVTSFLHRHQPGGTRKRLDRESQELLEQLLNEHVWPTLPRGATTTRRAFTYWFDQWNIEPEVAEPELAPQIRRALDAHYSADHHTLESALGFEISWAAAGERRGDVPQGDVDSWLESS
jgi:hypothetical protein